MGVYWRQPEEVGMSTYGQFCPVAKAMEVLDERWTLLVVRELLAGSSHFNELRRGVPRMSPALLSKRLRTLERAGVVRRTEQGGRTSYALTESGRELRVVVEALGVWGVRWVGELGAEDLDPHLLLWDIRRTVPLDAWPRSRTVLAIEFDDVDPRAARWWIVVSGDEVDVCDYDPGFEVTATLHTGLRTLTRLWRGDLEWAQLLAGGGCRVDGPSAVRREIPRWLGRSTLAVVPRPVTAVG
ncbi:winged helix-turn-helix transcriptional regulator [Nocardioides lijunqiniae]|uniref:winged helix-turn-helix transcriptional regulator n=1 Tax=Nocardioides lijunqiniae TaxID=2760832 RepID=UPI001D0C6DB0|nr:helix-turn-helix domain-containing protein [Nocardioides lijunqiniae]